MECNYFPDRVCPHVDIGIGGAFSLDQRKCTHCLLVEILKELRRKKK